MPEISIVTPSYKQLRWLKLCAASVADQQGVDFEHIIQDAGSGPELEAWASTQTKAQVIQEKDNGMYDAINRGFRRARGDILAWLNCDEQYLPGTLEKVWDFFHAHPGVDVLFGDALLIDGDGALLSYRRTILPELAHIQFSHLNTLSCATFVRRSVIDRGLFLDTRWKTIADGVWVAEMLRASLPMAVLPEPLSAFTILEENLGQSTLAFDEKRRWQQEKGVPPAWLRLPVILRHRIRKLLSGAYAMRKISTALYTQSSPDKRVPVSAENLTFTWKRA